MKIKYLGTAAYEGVPSLFCVCEVCKAARKKGGRAIRTRSQALIDEKILIDFPADTLIHTMQHGIDLSQIRHCLITHNHSDHLYVEDMRMLEIWYAAPPKDYSLTCYASKIAGTKIEEILPVTSPKLNLITVEEFESVKVDGYTVTPLPASHTPSSGPVIYQLTREGKTMLYANDTFIFSDEIFEFWKKTKPYFNLVSFDCTSGVTRAEKSTHMGFLNNLDMRAKMLEIGVVDENTIFVANHFSHNGKNVDYDEFSSIAMKEGFVTSYDGLEIEF